MTTLAPLASLSLLATLLGPAEPEPPPADAACKRAQLAVARNVADLLDISAEIVVRRADASFRYTQQPTPYPDVDVMFHVVEVNEALRIRTYLPGDESFQFQRDERLDVVGGDIARSIATSVLARRETACGIAPGAPVEPVPDNAAPSPSSTTADADPPPINVTVKPHIVIEMPPAVASDTPPRTTTEAAYATPVTPARPGATLGAVAWGITVPSAITGITGFVIAAVYDYKRDDIDPASRKYSDYVHVGFGAGLASSVIFAVGMGVGIAAAAKNANHKNKRLVTPVVAPSARGVKLGAIIVF